MVTVGGGSYTPSESSAKKAFDAVHAKFKPYVRIDELRDEMGLGQKEFDDMLHKLTMDGTIRLNTGDVTILSETARNKLYIDPNNFTQMIVTWMK